MMLCSGNAIEYETLKTASTETYLLKLENNIDTLVEQQKQIEEIKRKNKKLSNNVDVSTITIPVSGIVNGRNVVDFIEKRVKNNG